MRLLSSAVVILLVTGFSSTASSQVVVNFPDPNLEALIRAYIEKPTDPIYDTDLQALTDLLADSLSIGDLTGLEYCTNLTSLFLSYNQIDDIGPLAGLTGLQDLRLYANQISDISALTGLANLINLDLGDNRISDVSPLAAFTNLTWLLLDDNQITDIGMLVTNPGIASADIVFLYGNRLSCESVEVHIPVLEARGVGVSWSYTGQCTDTDGDGVADPEDNCTQVQNGPLAGPNNQINTDGDDFGNACDCDFDSNSWCDIQDFNLFLSDFITGTDSGVGTDMSGDGTVGIDDFNLFLPGFVAGVPGPSGILDLPWFSGLFVSPTPTPTATPTAPSAPETIAMCAPFQRGSVVVPYQDVVRYQAAGYVIGACAIPPMVVMCVELATTWRSTLVSLSSVATRQEQGWTLGECFPSLTTAMCAPCQAGTVLIRDVDVTGYQMAGYTIGQCTMHPTTPMCAAPPYPPQTVIVPNCRVPIRQNLGWTVGECIGGPL